jgi:hypothetical protein
VQGPAFSESGTVTDVDGDAASLCIERVEKRAAFFFESERMVFLVVRNQDLHRFAGREDGI